jgi:hypothetical protein
VLKSLVLENREATCKYQVASLYQWPLSIATAFASSSICGLFDAEYLFGYDLY